MNQSDCSVCDLILYMILEPHCITAAILLCSTYTGPLKSVSNIIRQKLPNHDSVSYFWEPPPTLDLTGVDPNIVYCVEISNITCGWSVLIQSECGLTNPVLMGDGLDPSYVYEINVTPRSNVREASNGTVFSRQGIYRTAISET